MQRTSALKFTVAIVITLALQLVASRVGAAPQENAYFIVKLSDLQVTDGKLPAGSDGGWTRWRRRLAMRPYAVLDGEGEAFVDIDWGLWSSNNEYAEANLAIRVEATREVTGTLYLANDDLIGMDGFRFRVGADAASSASRAAFYAAKEKAYENLLARDLPGAAWFRHQASEARVAQGEAAKPRDEEERFRERPSELEDTFLLFTGGRAISENLQLDRALPPADGDMENVVDVDSISGITIAELDWKPLVEDLDPKLDALSASIPADQHAIFFRDFRSMTSVLDEADRTGRPVVDLLEPRAEDTRTKERYETQLCLTVNAIARLLGPRVISSVAMTGSDPYLRLGSDVAVLFEAKQPDVLVTYLGAKHNASLESTPNAKVETGEVSGVKYRAVVTPQRNVSSFVAAIENVVVVTNSRVQLERIVKASRKMSPTLSELPEFKFFRDRYPLDDQDETALLMLSDATIRRWCGPRWRIGDSRRTRAAAIMSDLQAANMGALARRNVKAGPLQTKFALPELGTLELSGDGVRSSTYGSLDFLTPISELKLDSVTRSEKEAYESWRNDYQLYWRRYFDPIAVRLTVRDDRLAADVTVMPLIASSDYDELIKLTRGAKIPPHAGDPHPGSLFHVVMGIDRDSQPVRQFGELALNMAPGIVKPNPLGWIGASLAIYVDDDPIWEEARLLDQRVDRQEYLQRNYHRMPLALRVDVADPLGAAGFLAAVRAFLEQTAPGMLSWENFESDGHTYVRISAASTSDVSEEFENIAIYYAIASGALTVTLNKPVLERALKRASKSSENTAAAEGQKSENDEQHPWLGDNIALRASQRAAQVIEVLSFDSYQVTLQQRAWSSLPILNEWKRLYPNEDPVELHARLWGVHLVCPVGGTYRWNAQYHTMESTVFGHPGEPKRAMNMPWPLRNYRQGDFGLTFEEHGLRAKAVLERERKE